MKEDNDILGCLGPYCVYDPIQRLKTAIDLPTGPGRWVAGAPWPKNRPASDLDAMLSPGPTPKPMLMRLSKTPKLITGGAMCWCRHGTPQKGNMCIGKLGKKVEGCAKCDPGYWLPNGAVSCYFRQCRCDNGLAANGTSCEKPNSVQCLSCKSGHHLEKTSNGTVCGQNNCTCEGGTGGVGANCEVNGSPYCVDCPRELFLEKSNHTCQEKICVCPHGTPSPPSICPAPNYDYCSACHAGYTLVGAACVKNRCHCKHGPAVAPCAINGAEDCLSALPGFHLASTHEIDAEPVAGNATSTAGTVAPRRGRTEDEQAFLTAEEIRKNEARVVRRAREGKKALWVDAAGVTHESRPADASSSSEKISLSLRERGYSAEELEGLSHHEMSSLLELRAYGKLDLSGWSEKMGRAARLDPTRKRDGARVNVCTCENGSKAVGARCAENGQPGCKDCKPGYELTSGACLLKKCKCDGGKAAEGVDCPSMLGRERADKNLSKCFPKGFQTCQDYDHHGRSAVTTYTVSLTGVAIWTRIWKVVGKDLGKVISSTCSDPRHRRGALYEVHGEGFHPWGVRRVSSEAVRMLGW